jgi:hypothetical protein
MPTRALGTSFRSLRAALTIALALAVLAPTPTLAAKGNDPRVEVGAAPRIGVVSPGEHLAFLASFVNNGPGTVTHVRFEGAAPGADFVSATAPCTGSGEVVACELGAFSAGTSVELTFVFQAPAAGAVHFAGSFAGDAGSGNPKSASADVWEVDSIGAITVDASPGFFGSWQQAHAAPRTFDSIQSAGQMSTVTAHPVDQDYAAMLRHTGDPITCANAGALGGVDLGGFGQAVDLDVADGGTAVDVTITYVDSDADPRKVLLVHQHDDGTCALPPTCDGTNSGNCFEASTEGRGRNKVLVIHAELPHNGRIKGI